MAADNPLTARGFRFRVLGARAAVSFERLYPALWPAFAILLLFLVVSLFDVWQHLPAWLHVLGLVAFGAALGVALWRARNSFVAASRVDALRRLETDSGITHQALQSLEDDLPPEVADPVTRAVWRVHRARLMQRLGRVRLHPPRSDLPRRDPWALRAALALVLCLALVDARDEMGQRLLSAFSPAEAQMLPAAAVQVQLWVTPPAYTRRAPLGTEQTAAADRLTVPLGSEALVQVHHLPLDDAAGPPKARAAAGETALTLLGSGSAEVRLPLESSGPLEVLAADGHPLAQWQVEIIPDQPPAIAFVNQPEVTHRSVLRIGYEATDDYGVAEVALRLAPKSRPEEVERLSLAKPAGQPSRFASGAFADLTAHPLAGLPVILQLEAVDNIDQRGTSGPLEIVLPEREFRHPLARAIIEQRKALAAEPESRRRIAARLGVLAESEMARQLGVAVPLSLSVAAARTRLAGTPETRRQALDLLWEIALYVEDGALSVAERELRALQEKLQQALLDNTPDAELEKLMQELQQAIDRFLEEMTRRAMAEAQNRNPDQPNSPIDPSQMVDRQDLQRMLDKARELMKSGARDAARQMLSQLQNTLENLQSAMGQMQRSPEQQALSDLQKMIQLQQNLLDRSFRMQRQPQSGQEDQQNQDAQQGQDGQQGDQGQQGRQGERRGQQQGQSSRGQRRMPGQGQNAMPDSPGRAAAEQEGLRRALGELMRRMGESGMPIPRALGQAEMEMRGARQALQQGQPGDATDPQSQALDLMQQGGQAMLEQLQQQYGQQQGPGPGQQPMAQGRRGRDPLGRAQFNDGGFDPHGTHVPDEADLGRARDVFEELQRRSGERSRPVPELDYYRRLLDRF